MTDLVLEEPQIESGGVSRRTLIWTLVTILVLVLGLAGAFMALKNARDMQERRNQKTAVTEPQMLNDKC